MKEKIKVRCAHCDEEIGEIHFSPEKKYMGCGYCGKRTVVKISKDGTISTKIFEEKHIPHEPYENIVKKTILG